VRRAKAQDLAPVVQELQAAGATSLRGIAAGLDERGIPAARGGKWSAAQVARLLGAAGIPFGASVASLGAGWCEPLASQ
jgi:Recombinase